MTIRQIEKRLGKKIVSQAYCVGREDSVDYKCAKVLADQYNDELKRVDFDIEEAVDLLPTIIYHLESTETEVIRSSITNYFLAREASKNFKVALAGEGSDELFGGYLYFNDCPSPSHHVTEVTRIFSGLNHANLLRVDKMSMAHGLEVRVPYLDQDVIRSVFQIDPKYKLIYLELEQESKDKTCVSPFSIEKWILRRTFRDIIPETILNRAKAGQCEGYSENFTYEFQQRLSAKYSDIFPTNLAIDEKEALIYTTIFKTLFHTSLGYHSPNLWPGTCRASDIAWPTKFVVNRGLAPKGYLRRGVLIE